MGSDSADQRHCWSLEKRGRECVVHHDRRSRAAPRVRAHGQCKSRLLRRCATRRQPVGELGRRATRGHRRAGLGLPVRASRSLGLRHGAAPTAGDAEARRRAGASRCSREQDRLHLHPGSRDRRSGVADRRADCSAKRRARRGGVPYAAVSSDSPGCDATTAVRRSGVGSDAGGSRRLSHGHQPIAKRRPLYAAQRARQSALPREHRRVDVERVCLRPRSQSSSRQHEQSADQGAPSPA